MDLVIENLIEMIEASEPSIVSVQKGTVFRHRGHFDVRNKHFSEAKPMWFCLNDSECFEDYKTYRLGTTSELIVFDVEAYKDFNLLHYQGPSLHSFLQANEVGHYGKDGVGNPVNHVLSESLNILKADFCCQGFAYKGSCLGSAEVFVPIPYEVFKPTFRYGLK